MYYRIAFSTIFLDSKMKKQTAKQFANNKKISKFYILERFEIGKSNTLQEKNFTWYVFVRHAN